MRILVTGASGYVGTSLVPALLDQGHQVLAWTGPNSRSQSAHPHLETHAVDLGNSTDPLDDVGPLDAVIWLAQGAGYRDFPVQAVSMVAVNLLGLTRTLDLARRAGSRSFVYASTGNVYTPSFTPMAEDDPIDASDMYASSKMSGEALVRLYQPWFNFQIVRIFGIYGPGQQNKLVPNLLTRLVKNQAIALETRNPKEPDAGLLWTPCHVRDAVTVLAHLATRTLHSHILNLAGPETVSIAQVAAAAAALLGQPVRFDHTPQTRKRDLIADTGRLRALLPSLEFTPFATGLAETVAALQPTTSSRSRVEREPCLTRSRAG